MSTKPDDQRTDRPAMQEPQDAQPEQPAVRPGSDRDVDVDLLIDMPQLSVEELTLELDASILLRNVKLDAKGLDAGLYLKADLDLIRALIEKPSGDGQERRPRKSKGGNTGPMQGVLQDLVGATRDAFRELSARTSEQRQLTGSGRPALDHRPSDQQDGRAHAALERARDVAAGGAKAAGLTAAGIAGGAILESRMKSSRKLPLPRRRNKAQAIGHRITKRLP